MKLVTLRIYFVYVTIAAAAAKSILCDPIDSSPPGSTIHGILQARVLEWVAIAFSDGTTRVIMN